MSDRTRRILTMAQKQVAHSHHHNIFLPKYETTKGTTAEDQDKAVKGFSKCAELELEQGPEISSSSEHFTTKTTDGTPDAKLRPRRQSKKVKYSADVSGEESPYISSSDEYLPSESSPEQENMSSLKKNVRKRRVNKSESSKLNSPLPQSSSYDNISNDELVKQSTSANKFSDMPVSSSNEFFKSKPTKQSKSGISCPAVSSSNDIHPDGKIIIRPSERKQTGQRIRDKTHACFFCQRVVIHMARHLELLHSEEQSVAKLLALPKRTKARKHRFLEITRAGDFLYNCNVVSSKTGEMILARRPSPSEFRYVTYKDYGPCPYCLGYMLKKHLWHHIKSSCSKKPTHAEKEAELTEGRHVVAESNAILNSIFGHQFSSEYVSKIIDQLRTDEVGQYCREDILIQKFGAMLFEKHGLTQCELIRQNMRQLGRLTLELRANSVQNLSLKDFLCPQKFDLIVNCTKKLCGNQKSDSTRRSQYQIPSMALKLGHALKKCVNIERGTVLRREDYRSNEMLLSFLQLMSLEWGVRISSNALVTLAERKFNVGQLLPLTSDLQKINAYIARELDIARSKIIRCSDIQTYNRLAMLTLTKIILFNKRRSGEAARMSIQQYTSKPGLDQITSEDLKNSFSAYEKKLAERLIVVNITGKRGRKVPIILTPIMKGCIDLLLQYREKIQICPNNPFVFARTGESSSYIRGHDCLRKLVLELGDSLEKPQYVTGTKLRKYVATVSQLFSLSENEYDWLARHLGHDVRVHREFYRLHEDAVEVTKVSRLLLAIDSGEASKFKGMHLKDIQIDDLPGLEEEADIEEETEECADNCNSQNNSDMGGIVADNEVERVGETDVPQNVMKSDIPVKYKRKGTHKPWKPEEKQIVFKYFGTHIRKDITPRQKECLEFIKTHPDFGHRKWSDIKFCVKNQAKKIKKSCLDVE